MLLCFCVCDLIWGIIMEAFSLEDGDYNQMFITQESHNCDLEKVVQKANEEKFLGFDPFDFMSPCSSIVSNCKYQLNTR